MGPLSGRRLLQRRDYILQLVAGKAKGGLRAGDLKITGAIPVMAGKAGNLIIGKAYTGICGRIIVVIGSAAHNLHIVHTDRMACESGLMRRTGIPCIGAVNRSDSPVVAGQARKHTLRHG